MKLLRRLIVLVLLPAGQALPAPAPGPAEDGAPPETVSDRIASARTYADQEQYHKVIETLAPRPGPESSYQVNHLLSLAYFHTGNLPEARRRCQAAIGQNPKSAADHRLLADIYLGQEKFALAAECYQTARSLGLESPDLHYRLATAYFKLGNHTGRLFRLCLTGGAAGRITDEGYLIEPVPGQPECFFAAPPASAVYHLQRALDAGLDTLEAHLLWADIWLASGRYERALKIYQRLEDRVGSQRRAEYHFAYARARLGVDDRQGYLDQLQEAIALDEKTYRPHLVEAYRQVADRYSADGDLQSYIRHLRLAVGEAPEAHDLRYALGNALFEAGRGLQACRQWQITLELQPDHPDRQRLLDLIRVINERTRRSQ